MSAPDRAPDSFERFFLHQRGRPHMSIRTVLNNLLCLTRRPQPEAYGLGIRRGIDGAALAGGGLRR